MGISNAFHQELYRIEKGKIWSFLYLSCTLELKGLIFVPQRGDNLTLLTTLIHNQTECHQISGFNAFVGTVEWNSQPRPL